ncbi:4-diphosphocytidyl-2-C-methyl-D-erythritol kinase [Plasmodium brasilianum]|uniref:4-diphosphocytidyl-2-C-methyl-D-erythritol kinase, putative n=2 Tax=Plasmodium (Plasmodium) TaxID=418103 RepID=A0A1A8W1C0_PLAMA|nr:4-diphosphocytidyl-2-C-methyl-D-erythritol kinase, putative [Plasmodium malariae]KAI4839802.1 4-diphosphocytidyl-2-C-methyl-D-erythritol kinase [Plasmodium brasilianum]SBS86570.1 4-diphosphocytidyl-2c-methyl-D-erythritol kinase [Plasmodium malariae]SBT86745.1 4-diphosphocytidyl-2-C-methyl-D-erythritol kinase, putative [Plasmodium malariae]
MKTCLKIKAFLIFLCIPLLHINIAFESVFSRSIQIVRKGYKHFNGATLYFFYIIPYSKIVDNKYVLLKKQWMNSNLRKRSNRNICEIKTYCNVYKDINDNADIYEKGNILCNNKMKLIMQMLNRTRWYDFKFFSPAKINLFLKLKEKKETYNELSTLMHSINLGDNIYITALSKEDQIKLRQLLFPCSSDDFLTISKNKEYGIMHENKKANQKNDEKHTQYYFNYPLNDDNIIIKVLKRYREELSIKDDTRFLVHVNKRIPIFSGVGGGSSNGATLFYFLEKYFYKYLKSNESKNKFLKKIGSDISFFSSSGFAYCTGKGNDVVDLYDAQATISGKRIYIFQVDEGLSSKSVYENVNYSKIVQYSPVTLLKHFIINSNSNNIIKIVEKKEHIYLRTFVSLDNTDVQNICINDLEHSAFFLFKTLKDLKDLLIKQNIFDAVTMSGSGSSLFSITKNSGMDINLEKIKVENIIKQVREKLNVNIRVYLCDPLRKQQNYWYKPEKLAEVIKKK